MQLPRPASHPWRQALSALTLVLLAACGGGGDGAGPQADAGPTTGGNVGTAGGAASSPASGSTGGGTTVAGVGVGAGTGDCGLPDFQAEMLARVNALRASGATCRTPDGSRSTSFAPGAAALRWHAGLAQAAQNHSTDMATRDYFSHTTLGGDTFDRRILALTGSIWTLLGENIAAGQTSVAEAVGDWTTSYDHCLNLMNPAYTDIGVACMPRSGSSRYGSYWTMDLGQLR